MNLADYWRRPALWRIFAAILLLGAAVTLSRAFASYFHLLGLQTTSAPRA